ncbi:hypothetical protein L6164_006504 [Bauhinia variegata]|uniref:Uncharacterized protein n=1 Tax=Bauhinia variegata TaxID=167791 RepID=A0ACB9PXC0_BAUVA|nr:hypothetical protein L6164_006504 [Bauhinia variegata]
MHLCLHTMEVPHHDSFISDYNSRQTSNGNRRLLLRLFNESESKFTQPFSLCVVAGKFDLHETFEYLSRIGSRICFSRKYVVTPTPEEIFRPVFHNHPCCLGFGFDSKIKNFKVVMLIPYPAKAGFYSLASGSWKRIHGEDPLFDFCRERYAGPVNSMYLNGVLHWVVSQRETSCNYILTFDVAEETFGELMLPKSLNEPKYPVSFLGGGYSLAVVESDPQSFSEQSFNIWVMKEYGVVDSWTKVFSCVSESPGTGMNSNRALGIRESGEMILRNQSGELLSADPETRKEKKLGIKGYCFAFIDHHVESLYLLDRKTDVLSY